MSANTQHPLYIATRRLVKALDNLENNLKYRLVKPEQQGHSGQLGFFERENAHLRAERENLNTAIAQLQYQYNDLHKVASTIYGKLDDSIQKLTQIIDE